MTKQTITVLACILAFFYILNHLMPMSFGDDYVYSFIWQGIPMNVPLKEDAVRVASIYDLFVSQWSHYLTGNGRTVSHVIAQFFLWQGKDIFNICNAFISLLLIIEIYWCTHKGDISVYLRPTTLCWIFFVLWIFTPRFPPVFLWLTGACNYLWPAVLLLGFLLPYIRKYYSFDKTVQNNLLFKYGMFFFGILAGWTNENSICWIIFVLLLFMIKYRKQQGFEPWMYSGLVGLVIGYSMLILAPGNYVRLLHSHSNNWFGLNKVLDNLHVFTIIIIWQFVLWYYCLRSLHKLNLWSNSCLKPLKENLKKDIWLVSFFCILSVCMSAVMILSPEFPFRSAFPGTVQLIIATGIVVRTQREYKIELLPRHVKKFLTCIGGTCFIVTSLISIHYLYEYHLWMKNNILNVQKMKLDKQGNEVVLHLDSFHPADRLEDFLSGFHTFENNLTEDPDSWKNVSFSRYYEIKEVRMQQKN